MPPMFRSQHVKVEGFETAAILGRGREKPYRTNGDHQP